MSAALRLTGVTLSLHRRALLHDVSLAVEPGSVVTLMGPSGSGKSSLLAWACGTLPADFTAEGRIALGADDLTNLPAHRRRLGILFQDDLLFPHMSVADNLAFGLDRSVRGRGARLAAVAEALAEAELPGFGARDPLTLSGGQRARIALLRVLLSRPRALLLDEPFGRLDVALRDRFRRFVFERATARGLPVLLVTHDPEDSTAAGGPVIQLPAPAAGRRDQTAPGFHIDL